MKVIVRIYVFLQLNIYIPKPKVELFRKTFAYSGADIWNSLPHDVKMHYLLKTF